MSSSEIETSHLYPPQVSPCLPMAMLQEQHTVKTVNAAAPEPPGWPPQVLCWAAPVSAFLSHPGRPSLSKHSFIHSSPAKHLATSQGMKLSAGARSPAGVKSGEKGSMGACGQRASQTLESSGPTLCPALLLSRGGPALGPDWEGHLGRSRGELGTGLKRGQFQGLPSEASPCPCAQPREGQTEPRHLLCSVCYLSAPGHGQLSSSETVVLAHARFRGLGEPAFY